MTRKQQAIIEAKPIEPVAVKEVIGRTAPAYAFDWTYRSSPNRTLGLSTVDSTRSDYLWWDKFRRGLQPGYEYSALFCKPTEDIITNSMFGDGVEFKLASDDTNKNVEHTNDLLARLSKHILTLLMQVSKDRLGLGDQYIVINPDGSLSVPSPDTVTPEWDALDYRKMVKVTICSILPLATVEDTWTEITRTLTIKNTSQNPISTPYGIIGVQQTFMKEFENLLGVIPVVHFAHGRSANEQFGHTLWQMLRPLFDRYNTLHVKSHDGAEIMGNPILTFQNIEDYERFRQANSTDQDEQIDTYGGQLTRDTIHVDTNTGLVSPGTIAFLSPPVGFTQDIRDILKLDFLLALEHLQIPEAVWGGEMGQARSTSVEQMKTFHQMIEGCRREMEGTPEDPVLGTTAQGGILAVVSIWLRMRALTDRQVVVDAVVAEWQPLAQADEKLDFEKIKYAHGTGNLTDETMVDKFDLVEDAAAEVEKAHEEAQARADAFDAAMDADASDDEGDMTDLEDTPDEDIGKAA